jgi:predicted CopG family antitoxin
VGYENETNERGERYVWLDHAVVSRLRAMRGPGESFSDVILRIARDVGDLTEKNLNYERY